MVRVYVLTEGSYSDYQIIGVFSTKDKAKEAQLQHKVYGESDIEEYNLDAGIGFINKGYGVYSVYIMFYDDGTDHMRISKQSPFQINYHKLKKFYYNFEIAKLKEPPFIYFKCKDYYGKNTFSGIEYPTFKCMLVARDKKHAAKIARNLYLAKKELGELKYETD